MSHYLATSQIIKEIEPGILDIASYHDFNFFASGVSGFTKIVLLLRADRDRPANRAQKEFHLASRLFYTFH